MNTRYSEIVETLSRAIGNTLDRYEDQGSSIVLHIRWPLTQPEKTAVKTIAQTILPGCRLTFQRWSVTIM